MTPFNEQSSTYRDAGGRMAGEYPWRLDLGNGASLSGFRRRGGNPPAGLFIHGFRSHCDGSKSRHLSEAAGLLGCGWLRYDQRGCGSSPGDFRRFTISEAIDDAGRVLDALDEPAYILVGSSLGALIAIHVASSRKHRIGGLVLIAPALRFTEHFIHRQLDDRDTARWRRRGYRWFPDLYNGGCFRLDYDFCADALHYGEPPGKLPCPVRAVHGTRDELLPWRDTQEWFKRLDCPAPNKGREAARKSLEIIDGGDHRLNEWSDVIARQFKSLANEVRQSCA